MTTTRTDPMSTLTAALEAFARGDLDGYLDLYHPEVQVHGYSPAPMGKEEVRGFYQGVFAAFPDARVEVLDAWADEDRVTCRFVLHGTHTGAPFFGVEPAGTPIAQPGITILDFRDGRCIERWSVADTLAVLFQLGAIAPPA